MTHAKSLRELNKELYLAAAKYKAGAFWRHSKSGDVYEVTGHSARESDGAIEIIYKPARHSDAYVLQYVDGTAICSETGDQVYAHLSFHRPIGEWEELVDEPVSLSHGRARYTPVHKSRVFRDGHPGREY